MPEDHSSLFRTERKSETAAFGLCTRFRVADHFGRCRDFQDGLSDCYVPQRDFRNRSTQMLVSRHYANRNFLSDFSNRISRMSHGNTYYLDGIVGCAF